MGQVVAYLPEWYSAVPTTFSSSNPLISSVILDMYTIVTEEENGSKTKVPVVTHQSLLNWYRTNMLRFGIRKTVDILNCTPDARVVKCALDSAILGHTEALGEASASNLATRISMDHPNSMAENRAFDRAVMDYLALDTTVYSRSDEIRGTVQNPASEECFVRRTPETKQSLPQESAPKAEENPAPVPARKPDSAPVAAQPAPAPDPAPILPPRPDLLKEIAEHPCSADDVVWLTGRTLNLYNSVFNGRNMGQLLDLLFATPDLRERGELAKTFYKYMRLPVRGDTEKAREITVLKYYLYSKGVLAVSRDGALYINMDKTSGE